MDIVIYVIISVLLFGVELFYFKIADKCNIIDKPNLRSSHTRITLRGGGIVFYFGVLAYFFGSGFEYPWFMLGVTLIAVVSFMDDVHSVPNRVRLVVHFTGMLLMFCQWGLFSAGQWWIVLPAWIVCTGIINAYNFMDGINGMTGGYSLAVLLPLVIVNRQVGFVDSSMIWVVLISVGIFCFFNYRTKAKCFAGDVGSVSMAFILLFMLGKLILRTGDLTYLVFLAVYGVDTVLTICHRLLLHEDIFQAHRKHAYQLMANELKIRHVVVSTIYMLLQLGISLGAVYLPVNGWLYFGAVVFLLSAIYIIFMRKYYPLHEEYLQSRQKL